MAQQIEKKYAIVSTGKTKEGKSYSRCFRIVETKEGSSYLSDKDVIYLEKAEPLLKVITTQTTIV